MPPVPITEHERAVAEAVASAYDAALGVYALFVAIPRRETTYFRLVVESWDDYAVPRTVERFCADDPTRSLVVVMAVADFIEPCARRLAILCREVDGRVVLSSTALLESLRRDLLDPLDPAEGQGA